VRCIFVLDILNGAVVRALRGERSRYEPIEKHSNIVFTSEPLQILQELQPKEVYIADLNLLMGSGENLEAICRMCKFADTMADIGVIKAGDMDRLPDAVIPVLGTETSSLGLIKEAAAKRKIAVSIDMKRRRILTRDPDLTAMTPLELLDRLNSISLESIILLELDRVGTSEGLDAAFLKKAAALCKHPLILGGGVKDEEDLRALERMGFSGALVATAVHNGKIPRCWIQDGR
jgi:phosphoribosylformimino-5-aminoimidazole carboxamide ribotide isomerase